MRKEQKRQAILDAALAEFLEHGYRGTSMDRIAARAAASKVTLYAHFADKQALFEAVFTNAIAEAERSGLPLTESLAESRDLARDLRAFAREHVSTVTQPHLIHLRRMIIGEAVRFPELARTWHRSAPERGAATLARAIARLAERGLVHAPDPLLAAQHLNYLILSIPLNEATFAVRERHDEADLHRWADQAIRVWLAAYGVAGTA
ncbi:TetR/AcrR family transcriptional regulator [Micromonospora sp. NPDC049460]|uniref:TetR/AcrR family transcriptional regulator n=1 Tax=Micromonospora sp. NPDC049460 TaxID=3364272 RepID=UPI0037B6E1EB